MKVEDLKIGTPVIYWSVIYDDGEKDFPIQTVVTSESWKVGDELVCRIDGISGAVALSHLEIKSL